MLHIKVKKRLVMSKLMDIKLLTLIIHVVANTMRFTILKKMIKENSPYIKVS
jgi:hypothetical protein